MFCQLMISASSKACAKPTTCQPAQRAKSYKHAASCGDLIAPLLRGICGHYAASCSVTNANARASSLYKNHSMTNMDTPDNYYAILGVPIDADNDTLKRAYRQLARRYHPDLAEIGRASCRERVYRWGDCRSLAYK